MPTVKKPLAQIDNTKNVQHVITSLKIFDREIEQNFFLQHILKPSEKPDYDIISISGKKGIGKSILIKLFIEEAHRPDFMNYCLTGCHPESCVTTSCETRLV